MQIRDKEEKDFDVDLYLNDSDDSDDSNSE